jgi:predicted dinucleotide-binding enzyme
MAVAPDAVEGVALKIVVLGRGNVGGGLTRLWEAAGHDCTPLGRDGGDAAGADVLVVAVPGDSIPDAFSRVAGFEGKTTIDATNAYSERNPDFPSLAHEVKSIVGGPVAKSFNLNFARLHDQIAAQRVPPGNLFAADPDAREVTEQLNRDAGYDPVYAGGLDQARVLEDGVGLLFAVSQADLGPCFYRYAKPGDL